MISAKTPGHTILDTRKPSDRPALEPIQCLACPRKTTRPMRRGLCSTCYGTPAIRERFTGKAACVGCGKPCHVKCRAADGSGPRCVACAGPGDTSEAQLIRFQEMEVVGSRLPTTPEELARPTTFPPGSPGKMAVMAARAAAGLPANHPLDACRGEEG